VNFNPSPTEILDLSSFGIHNKIYIKRDDLIHPIVSGNKWRKLKENFDFFSFSKFKGIISLGGAYSSHILSLSYLCFKKGIPCVLIIRGEEPKVKNDILIQCLKYSSKLHFCSRSQYSNQHWVSEFVLKNYPSYFFINEGGANKFGISGCRQVIKELKVDFDEIYCDVGTGATLSGLSIELGENQFIKGIVVLKGALNLEREIKENYFSQTGKEIRNNWSLIHDYHFGGYAKYNKDLIEFMRQLYCQTGIKTDPIYSGKLFFGLIDQLLKNSSQVNKKIMVLHSGGVTGIIGFEKRYGVKIFN